MSPNSLYSLFNILLTQIEASIMNRLFSHSVRFEGWILCIRNLDVHKYGVFCREKSLRRIWAEVNFFSDGEFYFWIDSQDPASHMFPAESSKATPGTPGWAEWQQELLGMGCRVASAPEYYHNNLHIWLKENWRCPFVLVKEEIQISGVEGRRGRDCLSLH